MHCPGYRAISRTVKIVLLGAGHCTRAYLVKGTDPLGLTIAETNRPRLSLVRNWLAKLFRFEGIGGQ
jgi:hypothetical protein